MPDEPPDVVDGDVDEEVALPDDEEPDDGVVPPLLVDGLPLDFAGANVVVGKKLMDEIDMITSYGLNVGRLILAVT